VHQSLSTPQQFSLYSHLSVAQLLLAWPTVFHSHHHPLSMDTFLETAEVGFLDR